MRLSVLVVLAAALAGLGACTRDGSRAIALEYVEREPGAAPYRTRVLVTAAHVRIDDGRNDGDFILFERATATVYSVNRADRRTLVIRGRPLTVAPPFALTHTVRAEPGDYPPVGGHAVRGYRLYTNGALCYELHAAEGLLPEAVAALREYHGALAAQQAAALPATPPEFRTPCALANHVFLPDRHLAHGLPVRSVDAGGRVSELMDYRADAPVAARLFAPPADFRQVPLEPPRGG
jgi:hypothetical protein